MFPLLALGFLSFLAVVLPLHSASVCSAHIPLPWLWYVHQQKLRSPFFIVLGAPGAGTTYFHLSSLRTVLGAFAWLVGFLVPSVLGANFWKPFFHLVDFDIDCYESLLVGIGPGPGAICHHVGIFSTRHLHKLISGEGGSAIIDIVMMSFDPSHEGFVCSCFITLQEV